MKPANKSRTNKWLNTMLICAGCLTAVVPSAYAGKEGVFISGDSYFILENATLSAGAESSTMQFVLNMHNGGQDDIDFNSYGVRIVDDQGNRYPAKLTSKQSARVTSGRDQQFRFISQVAPGLSPSQLKVNVYSWNGGDLGASTSVGDLSVSAISASETPTAEQQLISLQDIDAAYAPEDLISFRVGSSYMLMEDGVTYLYTDIYAQNIGTSGLQLPAGLQLRLKGADSATYTGSFAGSGQSAALLPGKLTKLTLRTPVAESLDADQFTLELVANDSAGERVKASLPLTGTAKAVEIGSEQPYSLYGTNDGLTIRADKAAAVRQADGYLLRTTVTIRNDGAKITPLPSLSAAYQLGTISKNADGQDQSVQSGFLSPQQSAAYQFSVKLPDGIDPKNVSFVLFEQKTAAAAADTSSSTRNTDSTQNKSTNSSTATGTGTTGTTGTNSGTNSGANNGASTSAGSGSADSSSGGSSNAGSAADSSNKNTNNTDTKTGSSYNVPILLVSLSGGLQVSDNMFEQAQPYQLAAPLPVAPNGWLDKNMDISLVELHMHKNSDLGYNTAVAKYKITNRGSSSLYLPNMGTELINSQGLTYSGVRQSSAASTIMPNTSYVISYSYMLPASETGQQLSLNVTGPGKLSVGTYNVAVQSESTDKTVSFYPFDVSFDAYTITTLYSGSGFTYNLNLTLRVDTKEPVIIDQNFSQMEFELLDNLDRVVATQTMNFTGAQKLISGEQKVTFANVKSEQFDNKMKVNVYETITTPSGPVKRLVKQLYSDSVI